VVTANTTKSLHSLVPILLCGRELVYTRRLRHRSSILLYLVLNLLGPGAAREEVG